jgi:hypothetical protein
MRFASGDVVDGRYSVAGVVLKRPRVAMAGDLAA